jgi:hypothetical protein
MHSQRGWIVAAAVLLAASCLQAQTAINLKPAERIERAGLSLAVPAGFEPVPVGQFYEVAHYVKARGAKALLSLSVSVFPVKQDATAKTFVESMYEEMRGQLPIRNLQAQPIEAIRLAGLDGKARTLSYVYRGTETEARSAVFIREVDRAGRDKPDRLAYVLVLEATGDGVGQLPAAFEAIADTLRLEDIARPLSLDLDPKGPIWLNDSERGFAMRLPAGWSGTLTEYGAEIGQIDYTLGGVACPLLQVVSVDVADGDDSQACGTKAIEYERKQGYRIEVLAESRPALAGKQACQLVLRKSLQPTGKKDEGKVADDKAPDASADLEAIEVRRFVTLPGQPGAKTRPHYALILRVQQADANQAKTLMETLAGNFHLLERPSEDETPPAGPSPANVGETAEPGDE